MYLSTKNFCQCSLKMEMEAEERINSGMFFHQFHPSVIGIVDRGKVFGKVMVCYCDCG